MSGSTSTPRRAGAPTATPPGSAASTEAHGGTPGTGPHRNGVCGTGHSNDRLVSATIDGDGYPVALDIREQATALGAARLRDRVLEALRRAHDDVTAHTRPAATGAGGPGSGAPGTAVGERPEQMVSEATRAVRQIAEQFEDVRRQLFSMARSGSD